jgi:WD40 repeat protein
MNNLPHESDCRKTETMAKSTALTCLLALGCTGTLFAQAKSAPVAALAYAPDGRTLAVGGHQHVQFVNVADGELVRELPGQTGLVTALAYTRDGAKLAAASGAAAQSGEIRIYGATQDRSTATLIGQKDLIHALAWSPDGNLLVSAGYDRLIQVWDAGTGKLLRTLKDHSDSVYGLAFSPDGKLLASAAADRAVKVWNVATGARLYTLGEATDWLYAVAWSPDGRHLAAAGVDKSIRVWEATGAGAKLVHSVFAHEAPVTRLMYAPDGQTLYSLSEDRSAKAWDTARMVEKKVYPIQPETPLALAVRPDQKQLALGLYDGAVVLLDVATGKVESQPVPVKPKPPILSKLTPAFGRRGTAVRVECDGKYLDTVKEASCNQPGVHVKLASQSKDRGKLALNIDIDSNTSAGVYQVGVKGPAGASKTLAFTVDPFAAVEEREANDSPSTGQAIALPATVIGAVSRAGDVDYFRFEAQAGQQVGVQVLMAGTGSRLEPDIRVQNERGQVLAESGTGLAGFVCDKAGTYVLSIRDRTYRGGSDLHYRLSLGDIPVITSIYPLGMQRGMEGYVRLHGVHLGDAKDVKMKVPPDAAPGVRLAVPMPRNAPLSEPKIVVGEFPEVVSGKWFVTKVMPRDTRVCCDVVPDGMTLDMQLSVPGTANGLLAEPGDTDIWRFRAKKGQRLILETNARRLGSPLDSYLEILDAKGQSLPRATLRCQAKTYIAFRDHDSATPGIRLETWNELDVNDYLLVDHEMIRIRQLPRTPDDDCRFSSRGGQRIGYLDTTPTHHSQGTPMYKVSIHPPGTQFPPNGFPVVTLNYRNDDGGPGYGKDSRLVFDPPADGEYQVRIGDSRRQGGSQYAYRLTVRPPRPSFTVRFNPTSPSVWQGGAVPITVTASRSDDYDGPIDVHLENVPPGFIAPATSIPEGEENTVFALWAAPNATLAPNSPKLKLKARARIEGKEIVQDVEGGSLRVVQPGDLVTTTQQTEIAVKPGEDTRLTLSIERRNGFKGRVPIEVRGLPHGVHVLDIGLNGILITERETTRTIVIRAEPWVKPIEHPIVVLAKREGKNTEHAAKSVLLRVK